MPVGKVYLVGAGPGHPELLTLKAASLLKSCDVVVYDRLIQEEVLALAKPGAERLYMGKPVGKHDSRQEEANTVLVRKAREGKMVVRLKGGDPFVFGRGGEEAEYLADHDVPFEVIPGVTSAFAAPLSAGIAVTHRDAASSVAVVTGHEATKDHERVNWASLAGIDTLVFLMGVSNTALIAETLVKHGKDPRTPAAAIQMAFWKDERAITGTLETIATEMERAGIRPPATLVIGEVVRRREKLQRAQRDLKRRSDGSSRFEPAPAPDELLRLATAGMGAQTLGYSLEQKLFDDLEEARSETEIAERHGLDLSAASELLAALAALGIIEKRPEGYQNLELASRYLRSTSAEYLGAALLHQARIAGNWTSLAGYARTGPQDFIPSHDETEHQASCEALARFAAPSVAEHVDLSESSPVLLVGYGSDAYRSAITRRWPEIDFSAVNPFFGPAIPLSMVAELTTSNRQYGAILLSGLLASANRGEVQQTLDNAAAHLRPDGLMVLHDTFLPSGPLPPPEVVLGSLARRLHRGGCRTWSTKRLEQALSALGFRQITAQPLPAGATLVTARR